MLTEAEALEAVSARLKEMSPGTEPFAVAKEHTIERPFGWVFFYNSKKFLETGEFRHRLAGNGPVIVNKYDGSVSFFGTAKPVREIVEEYERSLPTNH